MADKITPADVAALLAAAQQRGDGNALRAAVDAGNADALLESLGIPRAKALELIGDRAALEAALTSDAARQVLARLMAGRQKGEG